jgi:AcrR family transcriptional regulator
VAKQSAELTAAAGPHEPKRERGRRRVEAIYGGASEVFAEKGFDAATMTEIAARSHTAIGSLYRFFPTKEALGEFVIARALEHVQRGLAAIAERVEDLSPAALADALIEFKLAHGKHKAAAVASAEARGSLAEACKVVITTMREEVANMLATGTVALPPARARAVAVVLVHLLQAAGEINEEQAADREQSLAEIRELCRMYISSR